MTERGFLLGLLSAAGVAVALTGCSSSDDSKTSSSSGGTSSTAGTGSAQGGRPSGNAGNSSGTSGTTSGSGGASTSGGSTASAGAPATGGAGSCTPDLTCKPVAPNTGDPYADCVTRVNQFRACDCKPPLTRDNDGQMCADQQAAYDAMKNSAHAGFGANICKPQFFAQNECPAWGSKQDTIDGCAQQMYDEGPGPTDPCDGACYQAHGHFINMTGDYKMVTCGFATDSAGKIWTVQNYR
jgi:hypothetical protein